MVEQKIEKLLLDKFQEEEFIDFYLVEIKQSANKLEVFIDSDSGLTFRKCQQISRYLEAFLDEHQWLGEKYILEVSSPGIGRPLTLVRQYKKNIGRKLAIKTKDGIKKVGKLVNVEKETLFLEEELVMKEGKKKKRIKVVNEINVDNVEKAVVKITY